MPPVRAGERVEVGQHGAQRAHRLRDLARGGQTMIVVTHEMAFARDVADRIVFLDGGRVVEIGPPEDFFTRPRTERARRSLARYAR